MAAKSSPVKVMAFNLTDCTLAADNCSSTKVRSFCWATVNFVKSVALTLTLIVALLPAGKANLAPALINNSAVVSDSGFVAEPGVPAVPESNTVAPASDLPSCANASACVNKYTGVVVPFVVFCDSARTAWNSVVCALTALVISLASKPAEAMALMGPPLLEAATAAVCTLPTEDNSCVCDTAALACAAAIFALAAVRSSPALTVAMAFRALPKPR